MSQTWSQEPRASPAPAVPAPPRSWSARCPCRHGRRRLLPISRYFFGFTAVLRQRMVRGHTDSHVNVTVRCSQVGDGVRTRRSPSSKIVIVVRALSSCESVACCCQRFARGLEKRGRVRCCSRHGQKYLDGQKALVCLHYRVGPDMLHFSAALAHSSSNVTLILHLHNQREGSRHGPHLRH